MGALSLNGIMSSMTVVGSTDAQVFLPAHTVEVGDLPRAEPWGQVREEKAVALRGLDADEPEMKHWLRPTYMDVGIHGPAIEDDGLRLDEGIEIRAGEELLQNP